jgi:hypothetical protein
VSEQIEAVAFDARTVRVAVRRPLPVEPPTLAMAVAIRIFERHPVFDRVVLTVGNAETAVSRDMVTPVLGPGGFGALKDPVRYRTVLYDALERWRAEGAG